MAGTQAQAEVSGETMGAQHSQLKLIKDRGDITPGSSVSPCFVPPFDSSN